MPKGQRRRQRKGRRWAARDGRRKEEVYVPPRSGQANRNAHRRNLAWPQKDREENPEEGSGYGSSSEANDVWDDTLLIEAYEKAVKMAKESCLEKDSLPEGKPKGNRKKRKGFHKWKVGDWCKSQYSEDRNYYEAQIIDIDHASESCTVKYVGYGNTETVFLKALKPTEGESARSQQIQDATNDNQIDLRSDSLLKNQWSNEVSQMTQNSAKVKGKNQNVKQKKKCPQNCYPPFAILPVPSPDSMMPPPPPPPPNLLRNVPGNDEDEAEAMSAMLIAWYMSGYHTGYYQGLKTAKRNCQH